MIRLILISAAVATPAVADEASRQAFVEANILATFYHELGHGLIDILDLPVLGREEDAADTLSTLLIDAIWDEDSAVALTYDTSLAWRLYAAEAEAGGEPLPYWDTHSVDMQRYFNHLCLFYGARPDERDDVARELDLPEDRAEGCAEEFDLASASWGAMLEGLEPGAQPAGLRMTDPVTGPGADLEDVTAYASLIAAEVDDLNKTYSLPVEITVVIETCDEPNAFYDPEPRAITICTEYIADLGRLYDAQE